MTRKELAALRTDTNPQNRLNIAGRIKTTEEWIRLYDKYMSDRQRMQDRGIRLENYMSINEYKKRYVKEWQARRPNVIKNIPRALLYSDQLISTKQASAISEYFSTANVEAFLEKNKKLAKYEALYYSREENRGKKYGGVKSIAISEEQEDSLRKLAAMGIKSVRTEAFHSEYMRVKDVMKKYNESRGNKRDSWFYLIFYV